MLLNKVSIMLIISALLVVNVEAGIIKDLFQKVTNSNNKTEDTVKQSAPVCGSGIFSTPNENAISPEVIFITNRASKIQPNDFDSNSNSNNNNYDTNNSRDQEQQQQRRRADKIKEVANEFRFHVENVTLEELERNGFNRDAPVTFLMHGFTSGYPLQAWISAIVESYTIDRQTSSNNDQESNYNTQSGYSNQYNNLNESSSRQPLPLLFRKRLNSGRQEAGSNKLNHNLFIINWHYGARGIVYPRAVANIPIVASYVTRFINEKLINEAAIDPRRIQLIGHSLGAHLAGFIGKNTQSKLGRIYGLDPAGPCFGTISGPLYPASKRLAPNDAEEVITIHTNTALLGIDKPIGKYSIFVEGGSVQPGCKGGGVLKSLQTLTFEGGDFDTVACSHSRAPNLLTYRHDQIDSEDDCQLVAYECKDWDSFIQGQCGLCGETNYADSFTKGDKTDQLKSVECKRIGLDWQYPGGESNNNNFNNNINNNNNRRRNTTRRPQEGAGNYNNNRNYSSTRRPEDSFDFIDNNSSNYEGNNNFEPYDSNSSTSSYNRRTSTRRPSSFLSRNKRNDDKNSNKKSQNETTTTTKPSNDTEESRGLFGSSDKDQEAKTMFLKTTDTAPYCAFHYQVILELNEQFPKDKKPPISVILQDSERSGRRSSSSFKNAEQNSLSEDIFGHKLTDKLYTHLLVSGKKLTQVDHATVLFRDGLQDGYKILKSLTINYMSHIDPEVRKRFSSRLCLVRKQEQGNGSGFQGQTLNRFFFEPCDRDSFSSASSTRDNDNYNYNNNTRRPYENNSNLQEDNNNDNRRRNSTSRRPKYENVNHNSSSFSHYDHNHNNHHKYE